MLALTNNFTTYKKSAAFKSFAQIKFVYKLVYHWVYCQNFRSNAILFC